jgi:hypothetical protein
MFHPIRFRGNVHPKPGTGKWKKHKVPARPCGRTGTKWGMGVRQALFPVLAFGAELAASFPTLFSTASGVIRFPQNGNGFLRTAYSPKPANEQLASK